MSDYMDARNIGYWLQRIYHDLAGSTMVYMDARRDEYWLQQIYKELTGIDLVGDQRSFDWWSEAIYRHIIGDSGTVKGTVPANVSWQLIYASRASAAYPDGSSALSVEFWIQQAQRVGLESSAPPFDPASIPWAYWYKTDGLTGLNNNDPIPDLLDFSGNNNHAAQPLAAKQAIYTTGVQNGLPVAIFSGIDEFYTFTTPIPQDPPIDVWAVVETFAADGYRALLNRDGPGLAPALYISSVGVFGLGYPTIYWANSFDGGASNEFNSTHLTVDGAYFIARFRISDVAPTPQFVGITINDNPEETKAYVSSSFSNWDLISYTVSQFYRRGLAELAITSGYALTPAEVTQMLAYLNAKWGIF